MHTPVSVYVHAAHTRACDGETAPQDFVVTSFSELQNLLECPGRSTEYEIVPKYQCSLDNIVTHIQNAMWQALEWPELWAGSISASLVPVYVLKHQIEGIEGFLP